MKAVMLSIQPRHCENICTVVGEANGKPVYKKTVEVRKKAPKCATPFKCYIYETKGLCDTPAFVDEDGHISYRGRGQVIGEFVCDRIELLPESIIKTDCYDLSVDAKRIVADSCLTREEVLRYMGDNVLLYGLHISDLKIYDTPKELGEFRKPCPFPAEDCDLLCPHALGEYHGDGINGDMEFIGCGNTLTRPPQSWCHIEGDKL